jgi:hypothetical protein
MRTDQELMELARAFWDPRVPEPTTGQIEETLARLTELEQERLKELLVERRRMRIRQIGRLDQLRAELQEMNEL